MRQLSVSTSFRWLVNLKWEHLLWNTRRPFQSKASRPHANRCMGYIVNKFEQVWRGVPMGVGGLRLGPGRDHPHVGRRPVPGWSPSEQVWKDLGVGVPSVQLWIGLGLWLVDTTMVRGFLYCGTWNNNILPLQFFLLPIKSINRSYGTENLFCHGTRLCVRLQFLSRKLHHTLFNI